MRAIVYPSPTATMTELQQVLRDGQQITGLGRLQILNAHSHGCMGGNRVVCLRLAHSNGRPWRCAGATTATLVEDLIGPCAVWRLTEQAPDTAQSRGALGPDAATRAALFHKNHVALVKAAARYDGDGEAQQILTHLQFCMQMLRHAALHDSLSPWLMHVRRLSVVSLLARFRDPHDLKREDVDAAISAELDDPDHWILAHDALVALVGKTPDVDQTHPAWTPGGR